MEAGEESNGNINLKRQRAPLSDSEDNLSSSSEVKDGQKRRRLEASGRENRSPKPSTSGRLAEMETKPDTPMVPSIRSRVQQLTQIRDGGAPVPQRCLSDPGAYSPSVFHEEGLGQHLLGEGEFNQRMERFNVPVFQASPAPTPSPSNNFLRPSNLVSGIQQKLQCTTTPSSQQAFRMREERKQELSRLQPISENAWLKRSSSDPLLNQAEGDVEVKDGSFTEVLASSAAKQSSHGRGQKAPCETSAASVELDNSNKGQMNIEWKEKKSHQGEEIREEKEEKSSVGSKEKQLTSQASQTKTVLTLSFSEDQSFCRSPNVDNQNVPELPTGDEHSFLDSTHPEESNMMEIGVVCKETKPDTSLFENVNESGGRSYSEEEIEPSTDEELRLWRYPQDRICKEQEVLITKEQEEDVGTKVEKAVLEFSRLEEEKGDSVTNGCEPSDVDDGNVSVETAGSPQRQEGENPKSDDRVEDGTILKDNCTSNTDHASKESWEDDGALTVSVDIKINEEQKVTEGSQHEDDIHQQLTESLTVDIEEDVELGAERKGPNSSVNAKEFPFPDAELALKQRPTETTEVEINIKGDGAEPKVEIQVKSSGTDGNVGVSCLTGEVEQDSLGVKQRVLEVGESSKKVSFVLEPELIDDSTLSDINTSMESRTEVQSSDAELSSHNETAEIIDQMFEEVLEYAGRMEGEVVDHDEDIEGHDSGIGACTGDKDKMDTESEKERSEEEGEAKEKECDENNGDEMLTFPPSGILSPLSKSVEAVVTPLRLAVDQESNPPSLLLTPEDTAAPAESAPLYSVDAYRTQRQSKKPTTQSVTPAAQRKAQKKSQPQPSVNIKEKITVLNTEAGKLQSVINQTLQALGCCTDENHGRGSQEEAEAEKLLLVSCEKRAALQAEVTRLREERSSDSGEAAEAYISGQPCRGTVSISNIQLPLKVEFVCSSHNRSGRPSHYFFILIRYGPCNIVATPLATAADAQNGDTISFPTSVTLKDIRSSFEIDLEVYSLSQSSGGYCSMDRTTTKSRVTPRKLLNTITRSNNSLTPASLPALNTRRSSNFCLVGSHKITLASLGSSKFPLDKMKLEGKIRRLLGDEFQEKVPFLSPLEGNIYLRLDSQSHSNVQQQGFLTMFELISGFGVWHRRYFVLEACIMYYWNHPNDRETKEAEGSISLSNSHSQCVRPVERDVCARPFTFELVSNVLQQDEQETSAKCWFSADTKHERLDWMESLNQALLDLHTWNRASPAQTESRHSNASSSGNLRESIL